MQAVARRQAPRPDEKFGTYAGKFAEKFAETFAGKIRGENLTVFGRQAQPGLGTRPSE